MKTWKIRKINCYCVDPGIESGKPDPAYYWTKATEEEFNRLLDDYLSENSSKFNEGQFTLYIIKNEYISIPDELISSLQSYRSRIKTKCIPF